MAYVACPGRVRERDALSPPQRSLMVSVLEENGDHLAFIYSLHEVNPGPAETDAKGVEMHKKKDKRGRRWNILLDIPCDEMKANCKEFNLFNDASSGLNANSIHLKLYGNKSHFLSWSVHIFCTLLWSWRLFWSMSTLSLLLHENKIR